MSTLVGLSLVFLLCLVLSVFFTTLHSAYSLVRTGGGPDAAREASDDLLNSLVLGNLAANVGAASAATLGLRLLAGGDPRAPAWVVLVLGLTLVLLIPCEMVPRSLAAMDPAATIRRWGAWLRPWLWVARPFAAALTRLSALVKGALSRGLRAVRLTSEEVRTVVESTREHLDLESEERDMVHSIFSFGETTVREIMVPRPDMVAVEEGVSFAELMTLAREAEHSRIPVYRGTLDNIVGIVYVKDLLARRYALDGRTGLEGLLREAFYVPESKKIDDLLREFQARRMHMAIVVDEYGGTSGLVTIEDILEEIVGEIQDEHDLEEPLYIEEPEGTILVDARMDLDDFSEVVGAKLSGEGFETVGGLVYTLLGRVPEEGEEVTVNGLTLKVAGVEGRRIQKLRVTKPVAQARAPAARPEPEDEEGEA